MGNAHIHISRPWKLVGSANTMKVFFDDTELGTVGNGKTEQFSIPTGQGVITCTTRGLGITVRSKPLILNDIKEGEIIITNTDIRNGDFSIRVMSRSVPQQPHTQTGSTENLAHFDLDAELRKAAKLLADGLIDQEEFNALKKKLLAR